MIKVTQRVVSSTQKITLTFRIRIFFFFYIIEGLSPEERDYKAIKRGVLNPITSAENKFLILLGQVSKKTMLQSRIQPILANASAHLFASR
jgi:hypothetical protein